MSHTDLSNDFLILARLALSGRPQDVQLLMHRTAKKYRDDFPTMSDGLLKLLQESPTRSSPLRKNSEAPLPVDVDSRLQLLRLESPSFEYSPIFSPDVKTAINQLLSERTNASSLLKLGLQPTKSMLLTGPPGLGKTLTAKWIAHQLSKPLLVLDLAAVMSSYLGRTGNNIRFVLDYAKSTECILLLDEFDAIAKRRDDSGEIGELKRLVTVLLQEIDDWPSSGLLIAATNHPDLLDPAVWRRFEMVINFENPNREQIETFITSLLDNIIKDASTWGQILSYLFIDKTFSEIERQIKLARKTAVMSQKEIPEILLRMLLEFKGDIPKNQKIELACALSNYKVLSQRQTQDLTGVSRDTIRKYLNLKN